MLHFTPLKKAYKAYREEKKGGGIGEARPYSNEICVAHIGSSLISLGLSQYWELLLHLGNILD